MSCELCPEQTAEGLQWPGLDGPMTRARANAQLHGGRIYLDVRWDDYGLIVEIDGAGHRAV